MDLIEMRYCCSYTERSLKLGRLVDFNGTNNVQDKGPSDNDMRPKDSIDGHSTVHPS